MQIKAGDKIRYTSGLGTCVAVVKSITIGLTAKKNHSIAWMNLHIPAQQLVRESYPSIDIKASDVRIPADAESLLMYRVEMA
jgi:hypothetical protein